MASTDRLLRRAVTNILREQWDPLGVADVAQARNEYDGYALPLTRMLRSGASVDEIAEHLLKIETAMGLVGDRIRAEAAAIALRRLC